MNRTTLFWMFLTFVLLAAGFALYQHREPVAVPGGNQLVTLRVDELLANPEAWLGETVRVVGESLTVVPSNDGPWGVLYAPGDVGQIFVRWSGEKASFDIIDLDGQSQTVVTGVWSWDGNRNYLLVEN